jgi:diguanylate cyclase (GGDEF)-like protein
MSAQITAYISIICASGVLNLILCIYVFLKRHIYSNIAYFFIAYVATITIYCFASATGLLATNIDEIKFWTIFQYIGIAISPAFGLLFVLKYLGFNPSKWVISAILLIPCITVLMVATNDIHHLHYRVYEVDPLLGAPFIYQIEGFWYMIHGTITFSYMFVAAILACSRWKETNQVYRPQLITLIVGQTVPIVVIFLYLIDVTPRGVDPLPMALWITSTLYLWCIKSSRLFTMMPIAKDTIFNNINDGVLVLDDSKQLIEYNQACQTMFPQLSKSMLGTDFFEMWSLFTNRRFPHNFEDLPLIKEITIGEGSTKKIYHIRISSLIYKKNSKGYLIIFTDITEIKELQLQLEHQAFYDDLTQIYNRRAFFQKSEKEYEQAKRERVPYTLILIDIDHFKKVNDTYGHQIGDAIIVHTVNVCKSILPADALFARYGGEEFVIALEGYTAAMGEKLAYTLCEQVSSKYCVTDQVTLNVTISIGVAEAMVEEAESLQKVLNKADQALYLAKQAGRNDVKVYSDVPQSEVQTTVIQ